MKGFHQRAMFVVERIELIKDLISDGVREDQRIYVLGP